MTFGVSTIKKFCVTDTQGDQKIKEKNHPILGKSSQNSCQTKNTKISSSKLNLKVQNIYNKPHFAQAIHLGL
jgi:hypothetical protein